MDIVLQNMIGPDRWFARIHKEGDTQTGTLYRDHSESSLSVPTLLPQEFCEESRLLVQSHKNE